MKKREPPSEDAFEKLLSWLDSDREEAGRKYTRIHLRIIRIFSAKGCCDAEEIADETFNVVSRKIDWLIANYVGDPALYFMGVARKLYQEWMKRRIPQPPLPDAASPEVERECFCLEQCMEEVLSSDERTLALRYHPPERKQTIPERKRLAEELGITVNALRIRVHHIKARLEPCITACLSQLPSE
jgi:DNA-directed RNA polymerase specialized sigma24 family protein